MKTQKRGNHLIDRTGQKFGHLTVLKFSHSQKRKNRTTTKTFWKCICECGKIKIVCSSDLVTGNTTSCGCLKCIKHRHALKNKRTRTYVTWQSIKSRCFNEKDTAYEHYGGRGITICERWLDFRNFLEDMSVRPEDTTIDRIDPDGNYEPNNCRWASKKIQGINKGSTRFFKINGKTKSFTEWAEEYGINKNTLEKRMRIYKWSFEKALTTPIKEKYRND